MNFSEWTNFSLEILFDDIVVMWDPFDKVLKAGHILAGLFF